MNKKANYLAVVPVFGSVILLFWLFIKTIRREIDVKEFAACFASGGIIGFASILISVLLFKFVNTLLESSFLDSYGLALGFVLGGYFMNLFTFTMVNKKL